MLESSRVIRWSRWWPVAAALWLALPSAGQAQLGGLRKLKEKVDKAVGDKPAAEAEASPQERSPYNEYTLELRPEVADCFERALAAENAELDAFRAWAAQVKSPEAYQACQGRLMTSPEGQVLSRDYLAGLEKGDQAAAAAMRTYAERLAALTEKVCGPDPRKVEERRREARGASFEKGRAVCGYTEPQYRILKERVVPACAPGVLGSAGDALRVPGDGAGNFYVYSATEVEVLKARCGRLQAALRKQL